MGKPIKTGFLGACLICFALLVAACGGGGSGSSGSSSTAAGEGAETSTGSASEDSSPIKIGSINAENTKFNNDPARVAAVEAAAMAFNEAGGIDGREVEVVFCNNENEPNAAVACAQKLIKEGVIACVGCENDFNGEEIMEIFEAAGIPMIENEAEYPLEYNSKLSYLTTGNGEYQVIATPILAKQYLKAKTYALVLVEAGAYELYDEHIELVAKKLGLERVATVKLPVEAGTFDSYAAAVVAAEPEVVIVELAPFQAIPLIKAIEGQGFHPKYIMNGDIPKAGEFKEFGSAADRIFVTVDVPPLGSASEYPQLEEYLEQLESWRKANGNPKETEPAQTRISSIRSWLAMQFVKEVLEGTKGEITGEVLAEKLNAAKELKSELTEPWTPSEENCFENYARVANPTMYFAKVTNNELVIADPKAVDVNKYLCE